MNGFPFGVVSNTHFTLGRAAPSPPPPPVSMMICLVDMFLADRVSAFAGAAAIPVVNTIREVVKSPIIFSLVFEVFSMRIN